MLFNFIIMHFSLKKKKIYIESTIFKLEHFALQFTLLIIIFHFVHFSCVIVNDYYWLSVFTFSSGINDCRPGNIIGESGWCMPKKPMGMFCSHEPHNPGNRTCPQDSIPYPEEKPTTVSEGEENPTERSEPVGGPKKDINSSLRKCKAGESYFDGCNRCTCPDPEKRGVGMCTMAWCSKYSTPDCVCEFK